MRRYNRQARSFFKWSGCRNKCKYIIHDESIILSLRFIYERVFNFSSTSWFFNSLTRSFSQRLLMWNMVKGCFSRTRYENPTTCCYQANITNTNREVWILNKHNRRLDNFLTSASISRRISWNPQYWWFLYRTSFGHVRL